MVKVREDMTGWVMKEHGVPNSRLTVIKQADDYVDRNGAHYAQWVCQCNCEEDKQIIARGTDIRNGHTLSCGCWKIEICSDVNKKTNKYDLSGEYGILWSTNTNEEIYFDLEDASNILQYCWNVSPQGYAVTNINKKRMSMHKLLGCKRYDHINRNKLDNRKQNLRYCTEQENNMNKSMPSTNTTGVMGVTYRDNMGKFQAQLGLNGKCIYLGIYINKDDAIKARLTAEARYFKEFAPQKHLFEKYGIITQQNDLYEGDN